MGVWVTHGGSVGGEDGANESEHVAGYGAKYEGASDNIHGV